MNVLILKRRTMFTASCLLKSQPRACGECTASRRGASPAVTSRHHYGLVRSRLLCPISRIDIDAVPDTSLAQRLASQSSTVVPHAAEPVRRVGLPGAATAALSFSSERTPGEHFLETSSPSRRRYRFQKEGHCIVTLATFISRSTSRSWQVVTPQLMGGAVRHRKAAHD